MKLPLTLLLLASSSCATLPSTADVAQTTDTATTAVALHRGFKEANPLLKDLNWPTLLGVKLGISHLTKLSPTPICQGGQMGLTLGGFGASLWNIGVMLGSGPSSIPLILLTSYVGWDFYWKNAIDTCRKEETK